MKDSEKIINLASECLSCKKPLCKQGCPMNTFIPEFIKEVKNRNFIEAYNILQSNNIMSEVCSNVCPYEEYCEGNCIKGIKGNPVRISYLEKQVNLWARENKIEYKETKETNNNIKIAIIGAGPAGISCGVELAKKGFDITIFEREEKIGGLLTYGIPGFRLPRDITNKLKNRLKQLDIKIELNKELGKNFTLDILKKEFKAIFIGIGACIPAIYKLSEEKSNYIYNAITILKEYNAKKTIDNLGKVVVIGGGNVALDSSRAAIRMDAEEVTILYRRSKEEMPAREIEIQNTIEDGVKIEYNVRVINANIKDEKVKSINCIKTKTINGEVQDIENTEFIKEANSIVFAIGNRPDQNLLNDLGIKTDKNLIILNEDSMTNINGVFAGGDVSETKATVCKAIAAGKRAAIGIENHIKEEVLSN